MTNAIPAEKPGDNRAFLFVFVTVLLDMLSVGIIIPVLPNLVLSFVGGSVEQAARIAGPMAALWSLMQFLSAPVLGGISDRFGRRTVILYSNLGIAVAYVVTALAPNLWWLALARVVSGVSAASQSTAQAYIADTTPPAKRAGRYGMLGAAFAAGFTLGPAIGGVVSDRFGLHAAFWLAAGMSAMNFCYGLFVLPESLPKDRRRPFTIRQSNPLVALKFLYGRGQMRGLASAHFCNFLAQVVLPSTFVLYAGYRFGWSRTQVGLFLGLVGLGGILVQGGLVRLIVARLGERKSLLTGLACGATAYLIYGAASIGPALFIGLAFGAFWGLYAPSAQALMTSRVDPTEQGRLQGALGSVASMAQMLGQLLFTQIFAFFISKAAPVHVAGASFFVGAGLLLTAIIIILRTLNARTVLPGVAAEGDAPAPTR